MDHIFNSMSRKQICRYFVSHKLEGGKVTMKDGGVSIAWKNDFPGLQENEAGTYLAGARHREGLTQRHISEMENAKKLAALLNVDYRAFL